MKDGRRTPFCYQTLDALELIRAHFSGKERTVALAIYQTLTFVANEQRQRETSFAASRKRIAELAGVSDRCLDRYSDELAGLGLLHVEKRQEGGVHLPNLWTLTEPKGSEAASLPPQGDRHPGEAASRGVAKGLRTYAGARCDEEEQQEEETPDPLGVDFEGWLSHHRATTGMNPPREGTKARQKIEAMYRARRAEGYEDEGYTAIQLELATEGAYNNEYRRENGYFDHESVLRPTKVHKLVEKGRLARAARGGKSGLGWAPWVAAHLPDLEGAAADFAAMAASMLDDGKSEVTVEEVRRRVDRRLERSPKPEAAAA